MIGCYSVHGIFNSLTLFLGLHTTVDLVHKGMYIVPLGIEREREGGREGGGEREREREREREVEKEK